MTSRSKQWRLLPLILLLWGCQNTDQEQESALQVVEILNRSQQVYFVEKVQFTDRHEDLQINWFKEAEKTPNYTYYFQKIPSRTSGKQKQEIAVQTVGKANNTGWKSYMGLVWIDAKDKELTTRSILCKGPTPPPQITEVTENNFCPPGFELVQRGQN